MKKRFLVAIATGLVAALAPAGIASAAGEPKTIPFEQTDSFQHVDGTGPHTTSRQRLLDHRVQSLPRSGPIGEDVGNVAVIADNGRIFIQPRPANLFDVVLPASLTFTPAGADAFALSFAVPAFDQTLGGALPLSDDDTEMIALPFAFPFLGGSYSSVFVNSDGNITFGSRDSATTPRDAARLIGGAPRIAPWLDDLDPSSAGSVRASVRPSSLVVTWSDVPEFGATNRNTFQMTLSSAGKITFVYQRMDARLGVIGVAEGGNEGPINELDLATALPGTFQAGAIFEEFSEAIVVKQIDVLEAAREFYRTHEDRYDYVVLFMDSRVDAQGAFAFALNMNQQTRGLGLPVFDDTAEFGLPPELETILYMNDIGRYWPDAKKMVDPPIKKFRFDPSTTIGILGPPGSDQTSRRARWFGTVDGGGAYTLGLNSAMSIMAQEAGHRWLAFPTFRHPTSTNPFDSFDLLGRQFAHWSFFFNVPVPASQFGGDPRASSMEGNVITELAGSCRAAGQTRFGTAANELVDGYTTLDQHMMGLRKAGEVGPFWYVDRPTSPSTGASLASLTSTSAVDDVGFCGKRVDLTIADIQAMEGPRVPEIGDEVDADAAGKPQPDVKTMAFVLVVESDSPKASAHAQAIDQIDTFRRTWQTYANGKATGGRGRFDTSLAPAVH